MDLSDYEVPRVLVTCRNDENENIPLYYHVVDKFQIQFGREEFCLVTGLKFGVENWTDYYDEAEPIPFRRILQSVLLGLEDRRPIPNWILRLANDRDGWDNYPWGSHPTDEVDMKSYSITGFLWAFKNVILESFRAATNDYYTRYRRLPRIVAWSSKNKFYLRMLKPFLHGQLPVERLVPDEIEARSRWWVSSRAYFDGRNIKDERIPRHLNRNNFFEVPSEMYREFEEHMRGRFTTLYYTLPPNNTLSGLKQIKNDYDTNVMHDIAKVACKIQLFVSHHRISKHGADSKRWVIGGSICSNPENVRSNVLMKLQEALDEEAILEEQILTLMHRFADRFTDRRVEINNLMVLQDHPLIDYGKYALGCMTGADMKKCVHLKSVRDELLRSMEEKRQLMTNYRDM
ncbi:hypothetical protein Tco_1539870 [Tanacetum coccineum]